MKHGDLKSVSHYTASLVEDKASPSPWQVKPPTAPHRPHSQGKVLKNGRLTWPYGLPWQTMANLANHGSLAARKQAQGQSSLPQLVVQGAMYCASQALLPFSRFVC